jgi:hypothetical protein
MPFGILECNKLEVVPGTGKFTPSHQLDGGEPNLS